MTVQDGWESLGEGEEKKLVGAPLVFRRMKSKEVSKAGSGTRPLVWSPQLISSSCLGFLPCEQEITRFGLGLKELI